MLAPIKREQQTLDTENDAHTSPKSQSFKKIDTNAAKYRDLVFFAQISSFAISTVFITFLFLTIRFVPFWAMVFALSASFGLKIGIKTLITIFK
ncbi:DUF3270 domain-containing protein [Streptococcus sciuri]|uniref:DUF3270 domain-containing protein n=1 Tax=Streptococcus sciuri TaxID=2973939 RepID=A0ABT2F768_9STRE|nr:DUF3270 domain-containing protein [Streptococcus sciuri]MCS4488318.1 DUF3270 domain-containing protein [Streptococcus sciuri]